ncbi:MAG: helix-turn-helix domain-containing protein [Bacteroidota bacterium]
MKSKQFMAENLLSLDEAAKLLKVPDYLVASAIRKGRLKGYRQFSTYFIFVDDLEAFIKGYPS